MESLPGNTVALDLEVTEQCRGFFRHTCQVYQGVDILDEYRTEISHQRMGKVVVGCMTATQYQRLSIKELTLRVVLQVEGHGIEASLIVHHLETIGRYGDELTLVVGGA